VRAAALPVDSARTRFIEETARAGSDRGRERGPSLLLRAGAEWKACRAQGSFRARRCVSRTLVSLVPINPS
jgi:hypothetical protein